MIPYFLLLLIPIAMSFVSVDRQPGGKRVLRVGTSQRIQQNNLAGPAFFSILLLLLMLRGESVGRDLSGYAYIFESFKSKTLLETVSQGSEVLYALLNWVIGRVLGDYQWLLVIIAVMTILPIAGLYNENRAYSVLKIVLYLNMSTYVMLFSGIRQSLAIATGVLAYRCVREKKLIPFLIWVLISVSIHHSAFILLLMYPLYYANFKRKHLFFIIPAIMLVYVFNKQVFAFLGQIMSSVSDRYTTSISETGALGSLILFALFSVFCFVIPDETALDTETLALRNFLLFTVVIQCFAPIHTLAMRMNYYYLIFIPLLIPRVIMAAKTRYKQIARLADAMMCVYFAYVFLSGIYTSYVTGISALDTVPYVPFWRG